MSLVIAENFSSISAVNICKKKGQTLDNSVYGVWEEIPLTHREKMQSLYSRCTYLHIYIYMCDYVSDSFSLLYFQVGLDFFKCNFQQYSWQKPQPLILPTLFKQFMCWLTAVKHNKSDESKLLLKRCKIQFWPVETELQKLVTVTLTSHGVILPVDVCNVGAELSNWCSGC